jgi:hypothetical protein
MRSLHFLDIFSGLSSTRSFGEDGKSLTETENMWRIGSETKAERRVYFGQPIAVSDF